MESLKEFGPVTVESYKKVGDVNANRTDFVCHYRILYRVGPCAG